jgi:transposase
MSHPGFGGDLETRISVLERGTPLPCLHPGSTPTSCESAPSGLVFESKRPIAHVALDLGVHKEALRSWVRAAPAEAGGRQDGLTSVERDELARLRGEVKQVRKANEILKAASTPARSSTTRSPTTACSRRSARLATPTRGTANISPKGVIGAPGEDRRKLRAGHRRDAGGQGSLGCVNGWGEPRWQPIGMLAAIALLIGDGLATGWERYV